MMKSLQAAAQRPTWLLVYIFQEICDITRKLSPTEKVQTRSGGQLVSWSDGSGVGGPNSKRHASCEGF